MTDEAKSKFILGQKSIPGSSFRLYSNYCHSEIGSDTILYRYHIQALHEVRSNHNLDNVMKKQRDVDRELTIIPSGFQFNVV